MSPDVLCIGAMLWDVIGRAPGRIAPGEDVPGRITRRRGGVALNVALALARHGLRPAILSAVGADAAGAALLAEAEAAGVDCRWVHRGDRPTDLYLAIEDGTGLIAAIADARALEAAGAAILAPLDRALAGFAGAVVLDGNLPEAVTARLAGAGPLANADLRLVSAGSGKALRLAPLVAAGRGTVYLNRDEAAILAARPCADAADAAEAVIARGAARVIVTDGAEPLAEAMRGAATLTLRPPAVTIARVTGAGDRFLAAHLAAERAGADRAAALQTAAAAAAAHVAGRDPG